MLLFVAKSTVFIRTNLQEQFEHTKAAIKQRRTDNTMDKRTNNHLQNTTQKTKD